jgi:UDP-GlcNAc:undecaprenyl-phosphate GlcNAc-1-phosphate transferase
MVINISIEALIQLALQITSAIILSFLAGPVAIFIAKKLGAIDVPGSAEHKKHAAPTPLAGGLVLLLALPLLITVFGLWHTPGLAWLMVAGGVIFIFGLKDDTQGLSAPQKFTGQFIAAGVVILSGTYVRVLESLHVPLVPWLIQILDWAITFFWLVGISNAFNLIDSMDGLVAGLATIAAGFFTITCFAFGQGQLAQITGLIFGLSLGLYFYNNSPARFFLGDSGTQTLGFLLAAIGIIYTPPQMPQGSTWFLPILVLGVPIFDTTLVVVSRIRRRKPIFQADLAHTYHRLVQLGMVPTQAVLTIQITALLLCNAAFIAMSLTPQIATLLFMVVVLLGAGLVVFFERAVKIES